MHMELILVNAPAAFRGLLILLLFISNWKASSIYLPCMIIYLAYVEIYTGAVDKVMAALSYSLIRLKLRKRKFF